ncbi:hypothetical protein Q9L42_014260 [Methylomarinum sp. Ch1-1]|uniref:YD repeat-containing protein n=1 Tax=Methylomarinum roseum TaxID=3067653 RepID=A0AAU7NRD6_9GAMM|nr:hypothetical protein [Methylomarinum sp. Ch1-1]MDP4520508.1 hypothetical protein [Methylomarinum sp. Ch1-1]
MSYDDGTAVEYTWDKLDLVKIRDRLGRETHYTYDALRRKIRAVLGSDSIDSRLIQEF